eukprot:scaffold4225_cov128-Cylindrotheca_fusiformis.AAC.2
MKFSNAALLCLTSTFVAGSHAFVPAATTTATTRSRGAVAPSTTSKTSLNIVLDDTEDILDKIKRLLEEAENPPIDPDFDAMVQERFPGAIDNGTLERTVVGMLADRGFTAANTLLATSLCADELARKLEDDFVKVYGNNFNLGGLSGFPFAGNTGFGAMAAHIPDNGYCLTVYGPHVGIAADGTVGKVERDGIALIDTCCGSAVSAYGYLKSITEGGATVTTNIQSFTDFQQGAVRELILPHGKRLIDAEEPMIELPYALYDSQDLLMRSIVTAGAAGTKGGLAMLGGIQINTGPTTQDYFHPLRFDLIDTSGNVVEDLLPALIG